MTDSDDGDEINWSCIVPFLDRDPKYAYGVEFGMLYEEMKVVDRISDNFCLANQDQILLLMSRLGWRVEHTEVIDKDWFHIEASRPE